MRARRLPDNREIAHLAEDRNLSISVDTASVFCNGGLFCVRFRGVEWVDCVFPAGRVSPFFLGERWNAEGNADFSPTKSGGGTDGSEPWYRSASIQAGATTSASNLRSLPLPLFRPSWTWRLNQKGGGQFGVPVA